MLMIGKDRYCKCFSPLVRGRPLPILTSPHCLCISQVRFLEGENLELMGELKQLRVQLRTAAMQPQQMLPPPSFQTDAGDAPSKVKRSTSKRRTPLSALSKNSENVLPSIDGPSSYKVTKQQDPQLQPQVEQSTIAPSPSTGTNSNSDGCVKGEAASLVARLGLQNIVSSSQSNGDDDNTVTGLLDMNELLGDSSDEEDMDCNIHQTDNETAVSTCVSNGNSTNSIMYQQSDSLLDEQFPTLNSCAESTVEPCDGHREISNISNRKVKPLMQDMLPGAENEEAPECVTQ